MADQTPPDDPEDNDAIDAPEADLEDLPEGDDPDPEDEPDDAEPEPSPTDQRDDRQRGRDQPRRGNPEFGRLRRENRELRAERDRLAQQPRSQGPDPQVQARQQREQQDAAREQELILQGDTVGLARFYKDQASREINERVGRVEYHSADAADKSEFRAFIADNPAAASVRDEVEDRLAMARQQGMNPRRDALAKLILGERMLKRAGGAKTRQQRGADREQQRQRARPTGSRSDQGGGQPSGRQRQANDSHAALGARLDDSGEL